MNYSIVQQSNPENIKTACLIVTVFAQQKLEAAGKHVNQASQEELGKLLKLSQFDGEIGKTATFYKLPGITAERVLVVGCGQPSKLDAGSLQRIHNAVATQLLELQIEDAAMLLEDIVVPERDMAWHIRQCIVNIDAARYRFDDFKAQEKPKKKLRLRKLALITQTREKLAAKQTAAKQAHAISLGVAKARDLGNLPGNVCTPSYLAKQAKSLQKDYPKLDVQILSESDMKKLGMGAFLSVSKGSTEPGKMIVMEFMNGKKDKPPVVLVGKGITFDTGGISIKQAPKMDEMKYDMCGAATVLGVINACAEMDLPVNLVGVVAAAENMPSGGASKPGDIVTSLSGQTIEILNTDAEGRLVLCDALSYVERYQPSAVIDIATLTGACIVALGRVPSGLFSNHQALAEALLEAGQLSHDRVWQMPVWDDYQELLKSNFADVANIGGPDGGSITAACFLSRFTKAYHWAHLDVAGTAWLTGPQKGATGRPVPLLMQYLMDRHAS